MDAAFTHQVQHEVLEQRPRQVHTITDRFSMANTYILNDTRLVVVDPGSLLNVRLLSYYIQAVLRRTLDEIDLVVLTHLHPDHAGGVEALRRICNAPVAASVVVRKMIEAERHNGKVLPAVTHLTVMPGTSQRFDFFPPSYAKQAQLIHIWLEDTHTLPQHPHWRVISSPGHTPESICLHNAFTEELLCGDTVVTISGGMPLLREGANRRLLLETLRTLRTLNVSYLYPGHGRAILSHHPFSSVEIE